MPRRKTTFASGEFYHLYNRGVNRQKVFFSRENYVFFLRRLRQYFFDEDATRSTPAAQSSRGAMTNTRPIEVVAYCLMPNHYHLLVQLHCDDLSDRMQSLSQSYTNAINKSEERVGPLFQGRFESRHVDDEAYLQHLSRYIHLNPIPANLVGRAEDWEFSSYQEYAGWRTGDLPTKSAILKSFDSVERYRSFVEGAGPALPAFCSHLALGDD